MLNIVIIAAAVIAALLLLNHLIYVKSGLQGGRKYGNEIAAQLGIPSNLFHTILEFGAKPLPHLKVLADMKAGGIPPEEAAKELASLMAIGVENLEKKFGPQEAMNVIKPTISRLLSK